MTNDLTKTILFFIGFFAGIFEANAAATATTTVSANIVPASSFSISDNIRHSTTAEKKSEAPWALTNNDRIETSYVKNTNEIKVKIISHHNNIYDLSISSEPSVASSNSSKKIKIDNYKVHNITPSRNSNNVNSLIIKADFTKPDSKDISLHLDTPAITVNYN